MNSGKKTKTPEKSIKGIRRLKKLVLALEIIFGVILLLAGIVLFVPNVKAVLVKEAASTAIGQKLISWFGSSAYEEIRDADFDTSKLQTNELKYNYSKEYTNFVMYGVDSRNHEVDASNSDSILIVSIHNTTGEVKMVSVYRDTLLGIYDASGNLNKYFKINSAYAAGGAEGAINTLNKNLDLDITDYVTVNFGGVAKVIDTLGGIKVNLTDDEVSQLNHHLKSTISSTGEYSTPVKHSGKNIKLNGIQATTYCRIRKATFYDPDTGKAISNDFGRAARQRSVMMKLVERAKKASVSELQDMVKAVLNDKGSDKIISTSFTFDEIVNMLPVVFNFELSGSEGFPSTLTTNTISGTSYVIPKGVSANVSELHKFLYGEKNYEPTSTVQSVDSYVAGYTGVNENTEGGYDKNNISVKVDDSEETTTSAAEEDTDYDFDDKGKSEFY